MNWHTRDREKENSSCLQARGWQCPFVRGEGSCGGGGALRDSAGSGATEKIDFAQQRKSHLLKVSMWPGTQGWPSLLSAMSLPQSSGHPWRREGLLSLVDTGCVWRHSWLSQPVGWHLRHHLGGGQGCCIYNPQRPGKPHNTGFS